MKFITYILIILLTTATAIASEKTFVYDSKNKRDPFIPLVNAEGKIIMKNSYAKIAVDTTIDDITLEGIVWDPGRESLAIINGKVLKEGEEFEGIRIEKIEVNQITVSINNKNYLLQLNQNINYKDGLMEQ